MTENADDWDIWERWLAESEGLPAPDPDGVDLDDELSGLLTDFDQLQAELSYQQAQTVLNRLVQRLDLSAAERAGLEGELQHLQHLQQKLDEEVVQIAVFGMVSRGKSSLLNALIGDSAFETGPTHGVTRSQQRVDWQVEPAVRISLPSLGRSRIELIDTPGIDEVAGEARERMARTLAQQSDLILFVVAGDMTRVEYEALSALRQASKPILLVFNKVDQYPDADRQLIYEKIRDQRVKELLSPDEIVMAAAAPLIAQPIQLSSGEWEARLVPGPPQVEALKLKILNVLAREGKALVALNTLLFADEVNTQVVQRKLALREQEANQVIWRSTMAKATAIALNPVTVLDVVGSAVIDVTLILTLAKLYGLEMSQREAVGLLQKIAIAMGGIGASELLTTLGLSSLKGVLGATAPVTGGASLLPYLSVAIAQASVAGVASYGIGQVTKRYLANGATWGADSPREVVQDILENLDQTYILGRIKQELKQKLQSA